MLPGTDPITADPAKAGAEARSPTASTIRGKYNLKFLLDMSETPSLGRVPINIPLPKLRIVFGLS